MYVPGYRKDVQFEVHSMDWKGTEKIVCTTQDESMMMNEMRRQLANGKKVWINVIDVD